MEATEASGRYVLQRLKHKSTKEKSTICNNTSILKV